MVERFADKTLEAVILHSMIADESLFLQHEEVMREEHFFFIAHRAVYRALRALHGAMQTVSVDTIAVWLNENAHEHVEALSEVIAATPVPDVRVLFVRLVELFNKRTLFEMFEKGKNALLEGDSAAAVANRIDNSLATLDTTQGTKAKSYTEWKEHFAALPPLPKYGTGVSFIDESLGGGIEAGQLILLMGDPEAGKTLLGTQILRNVSMGFPVLFFCFEFTVRKYLETTEQKKQRQNPENIKIIDEGYDILDIEREIKIWHKRGCRYVFIDSQMRVTNDTCKGSVEEKESEKFSRLAKLCHRLEITIVYICQQGKQDSAAGVVVPMGSKKGGHEASQIWYLKTPKPKYDEDGEIMNKNDREFILSKNKQNGKHYKRDVRINTRTLEFFRPHSKKKPVEVEFVDKDTKLDLPEML